MSQDKKKRLCLSVEVKCKILKEVDDRILTKTQIAKKYGIPKNTLSTIIKGKEKFRAVQNGGGATSRKYVREAKYPQMEKALVAWLRKMRSQNLPIDGNILKEQADIFALRLDLKDFKASDGWLQKFKLRHGLSFRKVCGESAAVDPATTKAWKEGRLQELLSEYSPDDIFNADETGLFYKVLPDKTLVFKGETCSGGKKAKQRITVMMGANMSGTEKLPLLVIGKSLKPRCFKNIRTLPCNYTANKKAWMTGDIFEKWVRDLDRQFAQKKRKIALVLDNCTAHVAINGLQAIHIENLPPNVTSVLQPMDQGIIQCFKRKYRTMLVKRVVLHLENGQSYEIDLLGALHLAVRSWNDVQQLTIANCFKHAGFIATGEEDSEEDIQATEEENNTAEDEALLGELRRRNVLVPDNVTFEDFLQIDEEVLCVQEITDDQIIQQVLAPAEEEVSDEEEGNESGDTPKPTSKEAAQALSVLRRFFEADNNACSVLANIDSLENAMYSSVSLKQSKITGFFKAK